MLSIEEEGNSLRLLPVAALLFTLYAFYLWHRFETWRTHKKKKRKPGRPPDQVNHSPSSSTWLAVVHDTALADCMAQWEIQAVVGLGLGLVATPVPETPVLYSRPTAPSFIAESLTRFTLNEN